MKRPSFNIACGPNQRALALGLGLLVLAAAADPARAEVVRLRIDQADSAVTFKATSRVVNADGRFHRFSGDVSVDPSDPTSARISITVEAASLDTANTKRDNHLRSQDFFWVERHPTIVFESVRAAREAGGVALVGRLTVRGVTREITVPVRVEVTPERFVARGEFSLKRSDYEINYQSVLNPVGDVVGVSFVFLGRRAAP
jgi:polyisoprenoid-binding protein YceI